MFALTRPPVCEKKKSPILKESSPIDALIFWLKREFLFAPQFMTDRIAEDPVMDLCARPVFQF